MICRAFSILQYIARNIRDLFSSLYRGDLSSMDSNTSRVQHIDAPINAGAFYREFGHRRFPKIVTSNIHLPESIHRKSTALNSEFSLDIHMSRYVFLYSYPHPKTLQNHSLCNVELSGV
jgi:hypothetical protein